MTADDSTPTRLADALFRDKASRYLGSRYYRPINQAELRTLAQQAYLAGKHDGWDEAERAAESIGNHIAREYEQDSALDDVILALRSNPYPVDGASQ